MKVSGVYVCPPVTVLSRVDASLKARMVHDTCSSCGARVIYDRPSREEAQQLATEPLVTICGDYSLYVQAITPEAQRTARKIRRHLAEQN